MAAKLINGTILHRTFGLFYRIISPQLLDLPFNIMKVMKLFDISKRILMVATLVAASFFLSTPCFAQPMSEKLQEALEQRQENAMSYQVMRDTMTANTWNNLMRLIHHLQRISAADSVIQTEYADLYTQELKSSNAFRAKLDSLENGLVTVKKSGERAEFPLLYLGLIVLMTALAGLGFYLLWLLLKNRKAKNQKKEPESTADLEKSNREYEEKLAEISQVLAELTGEREKTALEIEELTKTLQRERSQRTSYAEHYEKLSVEHNHLKVNLETLLKENTTLKKELENRALPSAESPDASSFITEIEALHAQLAGVNEEKNQLLIRLDQAETALEQFEGKEGEPSSDEELKRVTEELDHSREALGKAGAEKQALSEEIAAQKEKIRTLTDSLADSRLTVGQLENVRDALKKQVGMAQEEVAGYDTLRQQMVEASEKLQHLEDEYNFAAKEVDDLRNKLESASAAGLKNMETISGLNDRINGLEALLTEKEAELEKKNKLEAELKKLLSGGL